MLIDPVFHSEHAILNRCDIKRELPRRTLNDLPPLQI